MKISITVKPGAKRPFVEAALDGSYIVAVAAPAREGRANTAAENALAKHLGIAPSRVFVVSGKTSRNKIVEIIDHA